MWVHVVAGRGALVDEAPTSSAQRVRPLPHGRTPPRLSQNLPSLRIGNENYNFNFGFWPVSGRTWPRGPFNRVGLEKWCRNQPKVTL